MRNTVLGMLVVLAGVLLSTTPAEAKFEGTLSLRGSYFSFVGGDQYWTKLKTDFKEDYSDFANFSVGLELSLPVTSFLDVVFGADYLRSENDVRSDVLYDVNGDGSEILRDWKNQVTVEMMPIHVLGMRYRPLGSKGKISPYIGAQASVLVWRFTEKGTFPFLDIYALDDDNGSGKNEVPDYIVVRDQTKFTDFDLAINLQLGCEFYVQRHVTVGVFGRYTVASDQLNRRFRIFNIKHPDRPPQIQDVQLRSVNNFDKLKMDNWDFGFSIGYKF